MRFAGSTKVVIIPEFELLQLLDILRAHHGVEHAETIGEPAHHGRAIARSVAAVRQSVSDPMQSSKTRSMAVRPAAIDSAVGSFAISEFR